LGEIVASIINSECGYPNMYVNTDSQ
jgi:hypothetical protein